MDWKKTLIALAAALLLFGGGYFTGRTSKPVVEQREHIAQVEQKQEKQAEAKVEANTKSDTHVEDKTKTRKRVRIVEDVKPDGSKHKETTVTDVKANDVTMDAQVVTSVVIQEKEVVRTETKVVEKDVYIAKNDPPLHLGIHVGYDILNLAQNIKAANPYPKAGLHASYRFLGPIAAYGECNMQTGKLEKPEVFLGLTADF